jgi:hypothetical protein
MIISSNLSTQQVITLDMGLLVAGTKYRGEFEERLKKLMEEIKQSDEIILFIDEVHTLIGAGAAEGAIDAANILKPALARGELQVCGWEYKVLCLSRLCSFLIVYVKCCIISKAELLCAFAYSINSNGNFYVLFSVYRCNYT